ncbi:MAG: class I SAM-dependent methyltransferase [Candidatus Gastranaerophilales bacterium]|nr:class I SAM-dependent methyltransferase [Candidatus Gastranaerophilales bacterium]
MINNESEYLRMKNAEKSLWWYRNLHNLVLNEINENFKSNSINILDAGCGTGGLINFLKNLGFENIEGFDISGYAVMLCKNSGLEVIDGNILDTDKIKPENTYDVVISNDTFYFVEGIENKIKVLDSFYNVIKDNGIIIINLPALDIFRGTHDIAVGIKNRFNLKDINNFINKDKFLVRKIIFWPFLLSPIIFFLRLTQRIKFKIFKSCKITSDIETLPAFLNQILYCITEFENKFIKHKPFGSSIFLVLEKV